MLARTLISRGLILVALLAPGASLAHPAPTVIDWIWEHVGGRDTFKKARYLEFTWAAEEGGEIKSRREHTWDRYTGAYVLSMTDATTGDDIKVYFNVNTKKGVALRNGEILEGDAGQKMIERAYAIFINDTYWLLAPVKLQDYGVHVKTLGHSDGDEIIPFPPVDNQGRLDKPRKHHHETPEEQAYDPHRELVAIEVFFDEGIGLTPGDHYWLFVSHHGQVEKWRYVLQGGQEGEYEWTDEKDCGMGITLATRKVNKEGRAIVFPNVRFSETMNEDVFEYAGGR